MKIGVTIYATMLTYCTKLIPTNQEDLISLKQILEWERDVFNIASKEQFSEKKNSVVILHSKVYDKVRKIRPEILTQVIIRGEQSCLAAYRTVKSNRHKIKKPIQKHNLSIRLDKRLYAPRENFRIGISTSKGRKTFGLVLYSRLEELLTKFAYKDPQIYEKNGELYIALTFDIITTQIEPRKAMGVDLGCRVSAATSDGRLIIDRKFAKEKRRLRFLKRQLQSAKSNGSKSAQKHLKKLCHKEKNKNKNQTHLIANTILQTNADTIVLENLKSIKVKKHKNQNKNRISQVPLYELRRILTYKAGHVGKNMMLVCPLFTSQIDCLTGKREGERHGRRFYAKSGLVYDADINAAINIARLSKLPYSQENLLAGQAVVTLPIVGRSWSGKPPTLVGGK